MLRPVFALLLMLSATLVQAQTPVALFESFAGNINFTGIQRTIRTGSNQSGPCTVTPQGTNVTANMSSIPAGATILRAHLYWAGSGSSPDYTVQLENSNVSAANGRRYVATANGRSYFGGAADVTARVQSMRNATYRFRRLSVSTDPAFCQVEGVVGGFALLVIYSHPDETFRVLNVYEGFQPTHYSAVDLSLSNFRIPDPIGSATGRIGHITWEGDSTLGNTNAENLFFNGVELFDANNPRWNQFNSYSNINGDNASYGIDFDAYTVGSPTIQAGQTAASTRYQSGQDLVLLHSEVIAVPNVPVSDLSLAMTVVNASMTRNVANAYNITVTNNGPSEEPGQVEVTDTIDSDLAINSVSGAGWSCTVNGQQVSCSRPGPIASGTVLPTITISVTPNVMPGIITNTAAVTGLNFDNAEANNTASVTTGGSVPGYVFTDGPCIHNLSLSSPWQPCRLLDFGTLTAGAPLTGIYITALSPSGVPRRISNGGNTNVNFYFGLVCINPTTTAGIVPTFTARSSMTTCVAAGSIPNGTRNSPVMFPSGSPSSSVGYTFTYNDVGMAELYMVDSSGNAGSSGSFVSKPALIALSNIRQASPLVDNPAAVSPNGSKFVRAGDPFGMTISALSSTGTVTPNFGREIQPESFSILVEGATDPATGLVFTELKNVPVLGGTPGLITAGTASGTNFSWPEVGIVRLVPGVASNNYLERGGVSGTPVNVGRFYPHHFDTVADEPMPDCAGNMGCPAGVGAAYSGQGFGAEVSARNADNEVTRNYRGRFARDVTLQAWDANGGTTLQNPPASSGAMLARPTGGAPEIDPTVPFDTFIDGTATLGSVSYTFGSAYDSTDPRNTGNWKPPTTIYLRAFEKADPAVTSRTGVHEGPIHIVSGRLFVAHTHGSEQVTLPVEVRAQYWSGSRWENNLADDLSIVTPIAANLLFTNCTGSLAGSCALAPLQDAPQVLASGATTIRLGAPGLVGSAILHVDAGAWLPSTAAQITLGIQKATLDYIREVY